MNIDNAQLAAFAAALGEGTFEAAARKLNVTPSALSQRIKQLEERLGQVLIRRTTPCQVTAAGRPLLRYAQQLAVLESELLGELGVADAGTPSSVRIPVVVNTDSLDSWFPDLFGRLAEGAEITLEIRTEDQDHSLDLLRDGTVMAGVSANSAAIQGCRVEPLGVMRYLALASPAYVERYFSGGVNGQTLNLAPGLMFNRKDGLYQRFVALLSDVATKPPIHFLPTTRSFVGAVQRGLAWGVIPEQLVGAALESGALVELAPDCWLDVPLFWHRSRIASTALESLSQRVREAARKALRPPDVGI